MDQPEETLREEDQITAAMQKWQQGDYVLGEHSNIFLFDPSIPLSSFARNAPKDASSVLEVCERGICVVSQTCDIVKDCLKKPFVHICPLIQADKGVYKEVQRRRRPSYLYIAPLNDEKLVVDLDRISTVEKSIIYKLDRQLGCRTDFESRLFASGLARHRARFAFPDLFNDKVVNDLREAFAKNIGRQTELGEWLDCLNEVRVRATPEWNSSAVSLLFYFILERDTKTDANFRLKWKQQMEELLNGTTTFSQIEVLVTTTEDLTAAEYNESDQLDFDSMSSSK